MKRPYPQIFRLRQHFDRPQVADVASEVESQLASLKLGQAIRPGQSVAITAGSRGITNIHIIIRAIVAHVRGLGAEPFIVPAMGSHGGGMAAGQRALLESYGITEPFCGCPIRSSMETVVVCQAVEGFSVHFDQHAWEADHVVVCGRVKPHTRFTGDIQSGLLKMMLIGLGKYEGAKTYHRAIQDYGFQQVVRSVASEVLTRCGVVAGVAIVENAYDETGQITAVRPDELETREKELLALATRWMPRLPFRTCDVLLVDQIGKEISGTGMDANLIGRKQNDHAAAPDEWPKIKRIVVRALTEASHGNAIGLGIAEFCLDRVIQQMDSEATWVNTLTAGHLAAAMIPIHYPTDREILAAALSCIGLVEPPEARLMWIQDTLHLSEVECSAAYYEEAQQREDLEVLTPLRSLPLDDSGLLPALHEMS